MVNTIQAVEATAAQPSSAPAARPADNTVSKDTFLKLLVAQIRNQNPMSPADGIEFVTQLSQFTELEQIISMRQDIEAIRKSVEAEQAGGSRQTAVGAKP